VIGAKGLNGAVKIKISLDRRYRQGLRGTPKTEELEKDLARLKGQMDTEEMNDYNKRIL
jgi:hypothetical protein